MNWIFEQTSKIKPLIVAILLFLDGLAGIFYGIIHIVSLYFELIPKSISGTIFYLSIGILNFLVAILVLKKNQLALILFSFKFVLILFEAPLVGGEFNILSVLINFYILIVLYSYKKLNVFQEKRAESLER